MRQFIIECTVKDQVATITLNRPEVHNALNLLMVDSLSKTIQALSDDTSVRVIILQAKGENFCAGADLNWMKLSMTDVHSGDDSIGLKLARLLNTLYHLKKPTIAVVQGAVVGGGVGLVCCCDIVIAAPNSHFSFAEVRLGLIPAVISPYIVNAIGVKTTRHYFLSAEKISAAKALNLGLIDEILPLEQWQPYSNKLTANLKAGAPHALALTKELINDVAHRELDNSLIYKTSGWLTAAQSSTEAMEGINAFLENRPASWVNIDQELS